MIGESVHVCEPTDYLCGLCNDDSKPHGQHGARGDEFLEMTSGDSHTDTAWVPIDSLRPADSPRVGGLNAAHSEALAEIDSELPPIIVQRSTMRVIDGMHRLGAARIKNQEKILVQFMDCDEDDAFILSVVTNIRHGLPLTLVDRRAAAARITQLRPEASDRSIAQLAGLSPKTVAVIRRGFAGTLPQSTHRLGRDGRIRPLNATVGRRLAHDMLIANPDTPLRKIARNAGISVGTARDVREKTRLGLDPTLPKKTPASPAHSPDAKFTESVDYPSILGRLRLDPSLRYTDSGRFFLRWLSQQRILGKADWQSVIDLIPPHRTFDIVRIARCSARAWTEFADELDRRECQYSESGQTG